METDPIGSRTRDVTSGGAPPDPTPAAPPVADGLAARKAAQQKLDDFASSGWGLTSDPAPSSGASLLPVARFSPSAGVTVDRTGNSVHISGNVELYGPAASPQAAETMQNAINATWTHTFSDGHAVDCNVNVHYRPGGYHFSGPTQIYEGPMLGFSMTSAIGRHDVWLNSHCSVANTAMAAHEFGHVLGMEDRYDESPFSEISGLFGGPRVTTPKPGYEINLMAGANGKLESRNLSDLETENNPSPFWGGDRDQIKSWVAAHSDADIANLSTADKLRALDALQSGWTSSDDDMQAMGRVCASVHTHDDAEQVRAHVDPLNFADLGQRTQVRLFMSKMP